MNAYAKHFVRSIKSECLAPFTPLTEQYLRNTVTEYTGHYHAERNHQGFENQLIVKPHDGPYVDRDVESRERFGGILQYYYRWAA